MDSFRGRRQRRVRVKYEDIVPSTDLPPLVEGELRCFLFVTIGELVWGTTATRKVPPASPVYIRLRWWGEASNGTYFRPASIKSSQNLKCRAQFGIRSGPKQISAYFNDMGSATFDVLSSPTSLPIGRVQVPGVSSLTSNSPIRGYFPIVSASSRKLGELQISISFKPLRAAYDESSDTMTDGSFSARSRASQGGYGSWQSQSRASSVDSTKSRSSSRGSLGSRNRNNSKDACSKRPKSKKHSKRARSRSRSTDSRASIDIPTPRGIDALLEQNGHNLYKATEDIKTGQESQVVIKTTVSMNRPTESQHVDAIGELLKRGRKLRDEINQSGVHNPLKSPSHSQHFSTQQPLQVQSTIPPPPLQPNILSVSTTTTTVTSCAASLPVVSSKITPSTSKQSDIDMRILDMVFKAKGIKNIDFATPDLSLAGSSHCSLVSDLDDPLHDESVLQHLFYNQTNNVNTHFEHNVDQNNFSAIDQDQSILQLRRHQYCEKKPISQVGSDRLKKFSTHATDKAKLENVNVARVSIHGLQLSSNPDSNDELSRSRMELNLSKHGRKRKGKPPMAASPARSSGNTYFVEYKFPRTISNQRSIAVTTSTHEITRVASRKVSKAGLVKFDQHTIFTIRFNPATISKWSTDNLEFVVYRKKQKEKKACILGIATLPLSEVINNPTLAFSEYLRIYPKTSDNFLNSKVNGALKISIDLVDDTKDLTVHETTLKRPSEVKNSQSHIVTKTVTSVETNESKYAEGYSNELEQQGKPLITVEENTPNVCIEETEELDNSHSVCPRIASTVLYLCIMLDRARDIPATKLQSGPNSGKSCAPNVFLICRTFASDEASTTSVVWNNSNPVFNLTQVIPVKINNQLFSRMRNNYVVVEVWTKIPTDQKFSDKLMGLVKIPLQLFYQSLKDADVANAVLKSNYPVVSVDGFQPIIDVFSGRERGQLKLLLGLGTQIQVNALRKIKGSGESIPHHLDESSDGKEIDLKRNKGKKTHIFEITIHGLRGFEPLKSQVWGETDCFIQYYFPTQKNLTSDAENTDVESPDGEILDGISLESYRSDTTLCVPNPQFNFKKKHIFQPPQSIPIQNIFHSLLGDSRNNPSGGVAFEVWSRFYYPNVRDQLLAKGSLSISKLLSLMTMSNNRKTKQTFQIPLRFVDDCDNMSRSAGDINISIKYIASPASKSANSNTNLPFFKNVKLQIAILRGCGLKAAAKLQSSLLGDPNLHFASEVGVNSYVKLKASFMPSEKPRQTRCVARSFAPDYNHHFEFDCAVINYDEQGVPTSLASMLASGEIILEVWHKPVIEDIDGQFKPADEILLGRIQIPTCDLLYKITGHSGWHTITSVESLQQRSSTNVGAIELAMSFTCRSDLDLILRAAKVAGWNPALKSDLNYLLVPNSFGTLKPLEDADVSGGTLTTCVTITNAWLPKRFFSYPGTDEINKHAHVYIRYKFFDKDTVISSVCPVAQASDRKTFKDNEIFPIKLAHRKSFLCRSAQPLIWYLREESLDIQVWLSFSRSSRTRNRPYDSDKLLGTTSIDMSSILVGGLHRQQHISGLYTLFKTGLDDMGDSSIRVYLSLNPGDHTQPYDLESLDDTVNTLSTSTETFLTPTKEENEARSEKRRKKSKQHDYFPAVVSVERAMHLTSLPVSETDSTVQPSCYVTYPIASKEKTMESTKIIARSSCPVWNDAKEVSLDRKILDNNCGNLLFRIWQRDGFDGTDNLDGEKKSQEANDKVIGFATVDLSLLQAGFRAVNGWYNILDIYGHCQGQIKVAVTPTDPLYVDNFTPEGPSRDIKPPPKSPQKGVLHGVPLLVPVETPSGSFYYPGVKSQISSSPTATRILPSSIQHSKESEITVVNKDSISIESIPRRALFQHDTQSILQSALHRQMQELDQIKESFQKRLTLGDDPENLSKNASQSTVHHQIPHSISSSSSTTQTTLSSSQDFSTSLSESSIVNSNPHPSAAPRSNATELQDENVFLKLNSSTPDLARTKASSVHLSLIKPEKNSISDLDGTALSDNELLDVEFVQPINLNDKSALSPDKNSLQEPVSDHHHHSRSASNSSSASFNISPRETESNDNHELNNTSLWLSASTSHMDSTSKTQPDILHEKEVGSDLENQASDQPDIVENSIDCPTTKENDDSFKNLETSLLEHVSTLPPVDHVVTGSSGLPINIGPRDSDDERDLDNTINDEKNDSVVYEDEDVKTEINFSSQSSAVPDDDHTDINEKNSSLLMVTPKREDDDSPGVVLQTNNSSYEEKPLQAHIAANEKDDVNAKPSKQFVHSSNNLQPSCSWNGVPSFFPPRQDLLESMKTLQAITTEQKRKLLKEQDDVEDKENSFVSMNCSKSRRKLLRPPPSSYSNEQTERLARIFSTKFST